MDIEKIYADFTAARAANDLGKTAAIIAQVIEYGNGLAQAGRANEIPPQVIHIAAQVNVLIYHAMKLLSDGDAEAAKNYMLMLSRNNATNFTKFFHMLYPFGKALYATGYHLQAAKVFDRYEKIRAANWSDVDELSLFYRANCLALLGDCEAAARLYEQILTIKADFPEARRNLERVLRGDNKNLAREVKSLWDFPAWRDVPIFINARDRLGVMQRLIDWLLGAGYRKLIILDNDSTYPPLLEYYAALERDSRVKVIRLGKNFGFKALWLSGVLESLKIATPYVYTDPDILPIERCPKNFVKQLMKILGDNREVRKVGLGLVYDDITFFDRDTVQRNTSAHYAVTKIGENLHFMQVDTTLALYSNVRHYSLMFSIRTTGDLQAYHLPWYFDYDNLPDDEKYYIAHAESCASTALQFKRRR